MSLTTIFFDLDDTLTNDSEAVHSALLATCKLAQNHSRIQSDELCQAVRSAAQHLWRASPMITYCRAVGISSSEKVHPQHGSEELPCLSCWLKFDMIAQLS